MSNAPSLIQSLKANNGKQSITRVVLPSGAKALFHYHTQFRETFEVHQGELIILHGGMKQIVQSGQKSDTINAHEVHCFNNLSHGDVTVDIIIEPGHAGCEMANEILAGLEKEGKLELLSETGGYNVLWIVLYDITDTILTGIPKIIFSVLEFLYGNNKIEKVRQGLIEKYCS